ncbi:transcription-repair coupling factor [Sandaracinobacter sp. RS1-74]|uniref:transcription-repair coupling factor n=1 Tax=Sandaracinobacteroides sayramensis TaxID=2913411 RepID=UPI001EDA14CD|nr:transcription-repair coupling factor [Sandaracinobacteroides sayramensis]MCG2839391.1 transcription-repair coupling factor [Sandaracinobacteroides sayramensis]
MLPVAEIAASLRPLKLTGAPAGLLPWLLADLARAGGLDGRRVALIASDEAAGRAVVETATFFAPELKTIWLPAWDCLPYDRASPAQKVLAERLAALSALARPAQGPELLVTTVAAASQRLLPREVVAGASLEVRQGARIDREALVQTLMRAGYTRVETVADAGDFAVRGGLVDLVPPADGEKLRGYRLDFFGDEVDAIRTIDPLTQLTIGRAEGFTLLPVSELLLDEARIRAFRGRWLERFGADATADPIYQAASEGRRIPGLEHFLPLFEERLVTLFDWLGDSDIILTDSGVGAAAEARFEAIADYHQNRLAALKAPAGKGKAKLGASVYRPLEADALYLSPGEWKADTGRAHETSPLPGEVGIDLGALGAPDFTPARVAAAAGGPTIYQAVAERLKEALAAGRRVALAAYSEGSRERVLGLLGEQGAGAIEPVKNWQEAQGLAAKGLVPAVVLGLESGFRLPEIELWTEQDMLGDRLVRRRSARKADAFLKDLQSLEAGELVVHQEHGIGRYIGLVAIRVTGAEHDTVALEYSGGDKLYVPVENLDVLSRYGSESEGVALDKLGGTGWQQRKARMKERIREIAHALLKTAALRATRSADSFEVEQQGYAAFLSGFPWAETDDQLRATDEVLDDLCAGRPMDRLVCGDVGFGKTEVALRAAYVAAAAGAQVAVVCPTTLLARQHAQTFRQRFEQTELSVGALSRLVPAAEAKATRDGLADGQVDVVVGTHAILSKGVEFKRLGLVIVDEEQRFGVTHKERLKSLRHDVHVLTLTATPIPRTLQMALSGIRELSVIATPPVDRLAVRTTVSPFDPVVVREALLREHYRGGQSFIVVPRISDIPDIEQFLREQVPEVRSVTAHGQMAAGEIEERMMAFTDGRFDVLLATTIIESGIDIPNANTLIVHRADMYGLAQLYQLRGRVGRAKRRAYALLTTATDGTLTASAEKRLHVLASLDSLGAGFELASHDLDQRGAGNLLGDEQSGHIREVGFELYQSMLEDAILVAKAEAKGLRPPEDPGSPTISVDAPVMIPEDYVPDLALRMALYRRAAELQDRAGIEAFAAEMIDRFGKLPEAAANLLKIVEARNAAKKAHIQKIEVGPKGALVTFVDDKFPNPVGLVEWINRLKGQAKLRPDQKLFLARDFGGPEARLAGALSLARGLAQAALQGGEKAPQPVVAPAAKRPVVPGVFKSKRR